MSRQLSHLCWHRGKATHNAGSSEFDSSVTLGEPLLASGGALSGGVLNCWVQFDRPTSTKVDSRKERKLTTVKQAIRRYQLSLLEASRQYEQASQAASKLLRSELERIKSQTAESNSLQVVAAFYGQNVSWIDVTEKVRKAIGAKRRWSIQVKTEDWGEPAPGFGGPRTLLVAYFAGSELKFKAVYQGRQISLP